MMSYSLSKSISLPDLDSSASDTSTLEAVSRRHIDRNFSFISAGMVSTYSNFSRSFSRALVKSSSSSSTNFFFCFFFWKASVSRTISGSLVLDHRASGFLVGPRVLNDSLRWSFVASEGIDRNHIGARSCTTSTALSMFSHNLPLRVFNWSLLSKPAHLRCQFNTKEWNAAMQLEIFVVTVVAGCSFNLPSTVEAFDRCSTVLKNTTTLCKFCFCSPWNDEHKAKFWIDD